MCNTGDMFMSTDVKTAATWYQRARDVGAAHGFFSVESKACRGLGFMEVAKGRHEEGLDLLRNSLAAAELNELDDPVYVLEALECLIGALFATASIDEVHDLKQLKPTPPNS